jgi:hypothetical protein
MTNAALLWTQVTPNDCGIRRGEWLLTVGSLLELWTEEVAIQVSVSDA